MAEIVDEAVDTRPRHNRLRLVLTLLAGVLAAGLLAAYHAVDNTVTAQDSAYIDRFLAENALVKPGGARDYDAEIRFIVDVQRAVLERAHRDDGIPFGTTREPEDVLEAGTGLCYDRSRVIEKILRDAGFETRHVAVYSTRDTGSAWKSLLTPQVLSHAVTEVLTQRGWLLVDSNDPWVSLDVERRPVGVDAMMADAGRGAIAWSEQAARVNSIFDEPFVYVFGLYSRHGRFYPPYNPIPDVQYGELAENLRLPL